MPVTTRGATNGRQAKKKQVETNQRKRTKVLSAKVPKIKQCIYNENATDSPLLRLPPELRNRIWCIVLGDNDIHVYAVRNEQDKLERRLLICRAKSNEKETAAMLKAGIESDEAPEWFPDHLDRHFCSCFGDKAPGDKKSAPSVWVLLLLVCRQMHQEAALLPFRQSTFLFHSSHVKRFLQRLVSAQAHAIEGLAVVMNILPSPPWEIALEPPAFSATAIKFYRTKLTGLKELTIFVQVAEDCKDKPHFARSADTRDAWAASVMRFESLAAVSATVAVTNCKSPDFQEYFLDYICDEFPTVTNETARTWAREMEQRLIATAKEGLD